jgi:hypothetical protein
MVTYSPPTFQIRPVTTPTEAAQFLDLPAKVYANDPQWVPPFRSSIAKQFQPDNPFLQHGRLQQFIAVDAQAQPIGRIVAAVNDRLTEKENQPVGIFGFFECIENLEVAQALLNTACDWLRSQGMILARGPIDLSTHNNCLFLVDGFDTPPTIMMPYNPAYYPTFMEQSGWQKAKDSYAYHFPLDEPLPDEFERAYQIACKAGVQFRPIHTKGDAYIQDVTNIYHLFTKAFEHNYSSTPRSLEDFLEEARSLQSLIDPDIFPIAEYNGEMIGFWMALPDYNIALKHINGKLDFIGTLKFLWYRRKIDQGRVLVICSLPEYRRKMVPLALIYLGLQGGLKKGKPYRRAELGYVYEDNMPSRKLIEATGGKICKTYRIYEKSLV